MKGVEKKIDSLITQINQHTYKIIRSKNYIKKFRKELDKILAENDV